jgi:hypothetical protein
LASSAKLYAPLALAVVVALAAPVSVTVAPAPVAVSDPLSVQVWPEDAVKFAVWLAPLIVTA